MFHHKIHSFFIVILLVVMYFNEVTAQKISLTITDIRSDKGQIVLGIFKDNKSFEEEKPFIKKQYSKKNITNGKMTVQIQLEPGTYGISLLDDENGDGQMKYNFLGIPLEGFGFSNYTHSGLSRPVFNDFKFSLTKSQTLQLTIKISHF